MLPSFFLVFSRPLASLERNGRQLPVWVDSSRSLLIGYHPTH